MKRFITNIFATTGVSLVLLALAALYLKAEVLLLVSVFQVFILNILIHLLILLLRQLEWKFFVLQVLLEIIMIESLTLSIGWLFHWNQPLMLIFIGLLVYGMSQGLNLFELNQEVQEINQLIQQRKRR